MVESPGLGKSSEREAAAMVYVVAHHSLGYSVFGEYIFHFPDDSVTCDLSIEYIDERKLGVVIADQ